MAEYKDSKTALVADVDCTAAGKPLCEQHGVRGYPTIKYGDPTNLEDYKGGRSFSAFQDFANENLKPLCSPLNLDLCDDAKRKQIEEFLAMDDAALDAAIKEKKDEQEKVSETFNNDVKELQAKYEKLQKDKEDKIKAVKDSGLGLMNAVMAHKKKEEL
eukprot:gnl/MRDRNA2_/MRDRNA2_96991_c0_seq1.p1 gnl/MRDRNA2_/MRDRNA2_96991_c0~~gnl/MRDRNA2_/MRDRNA2_96991_c0_seq1.p1  ORF type:complete len:159 (-),score=61.95 gnl/MRDRNA2_/MRDRNA2_96991_c0_seq1:128-604(-)